MPRRLMFLLTGLVLLACAVYLMGPQQASDKADITNEASAVPRMMDASEDTFSIIVLPDTQFYSRDHPEIFAAQTRWIRDNAQRLNIAFVTHTGDVVDAGASRSQWDAVNASMSLLDGVVPYGIAPGNHDRGTLIGEYFPRSRFIGEKWFGGGFRQENSYQTFSAAGEEYIIVHLGFCPDNETLAWANIVLADDPDRNAIIVTHGFLGPEGRRGVRFCPNTQYIWDSLIAPNENVFLVLCGHEHAEAMRSDKADGRIVHQLLADYQDEPMGGGGYLRIMEFTPAKRRVDVLTYSPHLDRYETGPYGNFSLDI
ncbi:MAG: metallophosphoesterase [Candidatus Altiarchaeota archaeon]